MACRAGITTDPEKEDNLTDWHKTMNTPGIRLHGVGMTESPVSWPTASDELTVADLIRGDEEPRQLADRLP